MIRPVRLFSPFTVAAGIVLASLIPVPAAADLKSGVAAYRSGDYATALSEFTQLAKTGDAHAEFNLAILYLTGRGVEQDIARSVELHISAARKGLPAAAHGLGVFYYQGLGVKKDYSKALVWFRMAAEKGFADSEFNIGVMYFNRQGVKRDDAEVVKWVTLAASRRFAPAEYRLGQMYEKGVIFGRDLGEAAHWYRLAGQHGNKDAAAAIARIADAMNRKQPDRPKTPPETPAAGTPVAGAGAAPDDRPETAEPAAPAEQKAGETPEEKAGEAPVAEKFAVTVPGKKLEKAPIDLSRGIPEPPRRDRPAGSAPTVRTSAETKPAASAATAAAVPATKARGRREWRVQFASFRTGAEAERAWQKIADRAAGSLDGAPKIVTRADLGVRGIYHRLQAGPLENRAAATALCARLKHAMPGQGCLPVRVRAP